MFCGKCGKEVPDEMRFCPYCGTELLPKNSEEALAQNVYPGKSAQSVYPGATGKNQAPQVQSCGGSAPQTNGDTQNGPIGAVPYTSHVTVNDDPTVAMTTKERKKYEKMQKKAQKKSKQRGMGVGNGTSYQTPTAYSGEKKKHGCLIPILILVGIVVVVGIFSSLGDAMRGKPTSISATYSGKLEAGTVLNEDNSGIKVTAKYKNGDTEDVTDWKIEKSETLQPEQSVAVKISYEGQTCELKVTCTTITKEHYLEKAQAIGYSDLAREPDKYKGQIVKLSGQVVQVLDNGDGSIDLRIATKNDGWGNYYDDVAYVTYSYKEGEAKILEDDMITIYGEYQGTTTYTTVMGNKVTIPWIDAEYTTIG